MSRSVLVGQLTRARDNFCGIGTRMVKMKLNRFAKSDPVARCLRTALEIEDCSTQAKKYWGEWRDKKYADKHGKILELVGLCRDQGWKFGYQESGTFPQHIIYFDFDFCEQISFHTNFAAADLELIPIYKNEWDGARHSTLPKLERAIKKYFDRERSLLA